MTRLKKKFPPGLISDLTDIMPGKSSQSSMQDVLLIVQDTFNNPELFEPKVLGDDIKRKNSQLPANNLADFHKSLCRPTLGALSAVERQNRLQSFVPRLRTVVCDPLL